MPSTVLGTEVRVESTDTVLPPDSAYKAASLPLGPSFPHLDTELLRCEVQDSSAKPRLLVMKGPPCPTPLLTRTGLPRPKGLPRTCRTFMEKQEWDQWRDLQPPIWERRGITLVL